MVCVCVSFLNYIYARTHTCFKLSLKKIFIFQKEILLYKFLKALTRFLKKKYLLCSKQSKYSFCKKEI